MLLWLSMTKFVKKILRDTLILGILHPLVLLNKYFIPSNNLDELKAQLNKYFVHIDENIIASHVFVQVPCKDMREDKDEDLWKTVYYPQVIHNDGGVTSMFSSMVENNKFYLCVRSNCKYTNFE
jgi:hypothetical protein